MFDEEGTFLQPHERVNSFLQRKEEAREQKQMQEKPRAKNQSAAKFDFMQIFQPKEEKKEMAVLENMERYMP